MTNHIKELIEALVDIEKRAMELKSIVKDLCKKSNGELKAKMLYQVSKAIAQGVMSLEDFFKLYDETLERLRIEELN